MYKRVHQRISGLLSKHFWLKVAHVHRFSLKIPEKFGQQTWNPVSVMRIFKTNILHMCHFFPFKINSNCQIFQDSLNPQ